MGDRAIEAAQAMREAAAKVAKSYAQPSRFKISETWRNELTVAEVYETAAIDIALWVETEIGALQLPDEPPDPRDAIPGTDVSASAIADAEIAEKDATIERLSADRERLAGELFVSKQSEENHRRRWQLAERVASSDPKAATIARLSAELSAANAVVDSCAGAEIRIEECEAKLDMAREALEPFATVGRIIDSLFGPALFADDDGAFNGACVWTEDGQSRRLTWGEFRRARAALAKLSATNDISRG